MARHTRHHKRRRGSDPIALSNSKKLYNIYRKRSRRNNSINRNNSSNSRNSYYNNSGSQNSRNSIVGRAAPAIEIKTMEDAERLVKIFKEFANVLGVIYANWCGHCTKMMPLYRELVQKKENVSPTFAVEESNMDMVNSVLEKNGMKPLSADAYPTVNSYGPKANVIKSVSPDITNIEQELKAPVSMNMKTVSQGVVNPPSKTVDNISEAPPSASVEDINENPPMRGGSLMGAVASTAYHLAPAAVLLATAAVTLKRCKRKRGRKTQRS